MIFGMVEWEFMVIFDVDVFGCNWGGEEMMVRGLLDGFALIDLLFCVFVYMRDSAVFTARGSV